MKDDLISRQAAINALKEPCKVPDTWTDEYAVGEQMQWEKDVKALKNLPSAQGWIPVSEGLPDDLQEVNVTWVNHNPDRYYADIKDKPFTATAVFYGGNWYWHTLQVTDYLREYEECYEYEECDIELIDRDIEITAWQPMLEPYKEEKE